MRAVWWIACTILAILAPASALAREGPSPLFASHDMIHVTLKGPISRLILNRSASSGGADATLTVQGAAPETLPVQLSLRGITRRKSDTCDFPPIRLDFSERPAEASLFSGQKKLKLVTHCKSAPSFQQYVLLEYTAYRLFNVLTPYSFNARLVTVDYVDPDGRLVTSRIGFILESEKELARRNGLHEAETGDVISLSQLSPPDAARHALFEDLIGNLDWSTLAGPKGQGCCHNTKLISEKGATRDLIPIPYDFDFAGMVDAPYATPPNGFDLPDVLTRQYRGYCLHNLDALAAAAELRAHRAELLAMLDQTPELEEGPRRKAARYLDGFFNAIATDQDVSAKVLRTCQRAR